MSEREIFSRAIKFSGAAREAYVREACGGDDVLRRQVEALLQAHDQSQNLVLQPASAAPNATRSEMPEAATGTLVAGRYKLLEPIGEGGMGSVWLAEQKEPVKRKVALKLIKPGMDSRAVLARFEAERQALAVMDHPNIAKVYDGGMTGEGRPYFVMELVRGIPLTEYCDQTQLSVRERLELFGQVCSAVQHAHQKGIIHRDLKPSNILVTEHDGRPVCKVIDFGLAKAMHGAHALTDASLHTAFGSVVGTPLYMAPEQLGVSALDIDTRADLYSLGVILYELLTGSTPIEKQRLKQAALDEIVRIVREEEPPIPSQRLSSSDTLPSVAARRHTEPSRLTKLVRGDLDWIIMRALEKDRNRRYETANGLALDIQRYLAGEAVLAAPPSKSYRFRKFIRRNRGPVLAGSLILMALLAGIIGTSYGLLQASAKRKEAERQQARAEQREQDAIDAVKRFGDAVSENPELKNNSELEQLRKTLLQEPLAFFEALRARLEAEGDTRPESLERLAVASKNLGDLSDEIGNKQNAISAHQHALGIFQRLANDHPGTLEYKYNLAATYMSLGAILVYTDQRGVGLKAFTEALAISNSLVDAAPTNADFQLLLAVAHWNIGAELNLVSKTAEGRAAYQRACEILIRLVDAHPTSTIFRSHLAMIQGNLVEFSGSDEEALASYEQAQDVFERLVMSDPGNLIWQSNLASIFDSRGRLLSDTGKLEEALAAYHHAHDIRRRLVQSHPTNNDLQRELAQSYRVIARGLEAIGKPQEALANLELARKILVRLVDSNPTNTDYQAGLAITQHRIGNLLRDFGKPVDAMAALQQAREILTPMVQANPDVADRQSNLGGTLNDLAFLHIDAKRWKEARELLQSAIAHQRKAIDGNPNESQYRTFLNNHYHNLARVLARTNVADLDPATRSMELEEALTALQDLQSPQEFGATLFQLSEILFSDRKQDEALIYLRRGLDVRRKAVAESGPDTKEPAWLLALYWIDGANLLQTNGCVPESIVWYTEAESALQRFKEQWPGPEVINQLRWAYQNRGWSRVLVGSYSQAINDFEEALQYCPEADRNYICCMRATARLRLGAIDEALAEIQQLATHYGGTADEAYNLACFYAVAAEKIPDQRQTHADKAMEYLQKAVEAGWNNAKHLATDIDIKSLREREDFQALAAKLEAGQVKQ